MEWMKKNKLKGEVYNNIIGKIIDNNHLNYNLQ